LHWLDVGCGTGVFTEQVIRHNTPAAIIGIDPSAEQLAYARDRAGLGTAEFRVGDAQELPFPDESFDVAVMALVIHFVPNPAKAIAEMARVLHRGGRAAAYVWDYPRAGTPTAPMSAAMKAMGLEPPAPPSAQATSSAALEEFWRKAGFVEIGTRTIKILVEFTDFDEFWGSLSVPVGTLGKAIAQMTPDSLKRLRRTLQERTPTAADGRVVYEAHANAIKGRKPAGEGTRALCA